MDSVPKPSPVPDLDDFRSLADNAPVMLWVTDASGSCTFLNRRWFEFTGQAPSDGLGYGWLDAVHPEDRERAGASFAAANVGREPFQLEHRLRNAQGEWRWVIDAGRPRFDARGEFLGYAGGVTDIHERKLAEQSLRAERDRLDLVVEASQIGLWYCDLPFDEFDWNARVKGHFGLPPDARVTLDTFYERMHPDDREPTRRAIAEAIAGRHLYDVEYRTVGLDGKLRWIRAMGRAHLDARGEPRSFDGITLDVTERVRQHEQLREADRRKDEFLAILAHELRNPLAPIATGLALLELAPEQPAIAERARRSMSRQLTHLVRLVNDLLDVSRVSLGKLELQLGSVRLDDVIHHAVEMARPKIDAQSHEVVVEPAGEDVVVEGDATRLTQVVANLLHNAAKFTPTGGRIVVSGRATREQAEVRVRDNGIGIAPEMRARMFEMFTQGPGMPGDTQKGLGIGLALAHSLVRLHGGDLRAESDGPGRGAEFIVTLPRKAA